MNSELTNGSGSNGFAHVNPVDKFEGAFMSCLAAITKEDTLTNVDKDEIRVDVEQGLTNFVEQARAMEGYFLKKRLEIAAQKPELIIKDDASELRYELFRKDELLKKNYDKITHWQSILADLQSAGAHQGKTTSQTPVPPPTPTNPFSQGPLTPGQQGPLTPSSGRPNTPGSVGRPMTPVTGSRMHPVGYSMKQSENQSINNNPRSYIRPATLNVYGKGAMGLEQSLQLPASVMQPSSSVMQTLPSVLQTNPSVLQTNPSGMQPSPYVMQSRPITQHTFATLPQATSYMTTDMQQHHHPPPNQSAIVYPPGMVPFQNSRRVGMYNVQNVVNPTSGEVCSTTPPLRMMFPVPGYIVPSPSRSPFPVVHSPTSYQHQQPFLTPTVRNNYTGSNTNFTGNPQQYPPGNFPNEEPMYQNQNTKLPHFNYQYRQE